MLILLQGRGNLIHFLFSFPSSLSVRAQSFNNRLTHFFISQHVHAADPTGTRTNSVCLSSPDGRGVKRTVIACLSQVKGELRARTLPSPRSGFHWGARLSSLFQSLRHTFKTKGASAGALLTAVSLTCTQSRAAQRRPTPHIRWRHGRAETTSPCTSCFNEPSDL